MPKRSQTRAAIGEIVESLDPRDDVSLFAFSGRPFRLQPFTRDHAAILKQEDLLHSYGPTSLYDSMMVAADYLRDGCYPKRILVVISDGMDNTSTHLPEDATGAIRSNGVTVYAIAIGDLDVPVGAGVHYLALFGSGQEPYSANEKSLAQFTQPAGGSTFLISPTGDADLLAATVKSIVEGSRGEYVSGFIDATKIDPSAIKVEVKTMTVS